MRIPLAKYGWKEILGSLLVSLVAGYLLYLVYPWLVALPVAFMLFTLYFFRDPDRKVPEDANVIVSPADGRIIEITDVTENEFLKGPAVKIAIFLSVFNDHINRSPLAGKVALINYKKGKFLVASEPEASSQNESNAIGLSCNNGVPFGILLRQVSGILARRIVCACEVDA
ncbi:MAG: phosphatidylserine decarboxylase, partial [Planctomycetes bacterium]|nr:phosphatidylserine decarboxylase [Planctomycetota bacterium]